jgi:hypothetical protein
MYNKITLTNMVHLGTIGFNLIILLFLKALSIVVFSNKTERYPLLFFLPKELTPFPFLQHRLQIVQILRDPIEIYK